jgi:hypothetical protein
MSEKRIVVSSSPQKNIEEVIYINVLPSGKKDSITRFEALNPNKPVYRRKFGKERWV